MVLFCSVCFVELLQPVGPDVVLHDVVVGRLPGADVVVQFGVVVAHSVTDKGKDGAEGNVAGGHEEGDEALVQVDDVLPLKDVKVLDDLPEINAVKLY